MRRRRFVLLLRAMAMVPAPLTTMCGHQTRKAEEVQTPPPQAAASQAAHSTTQPSGGIMVKGSRDRRPAGTIEATASKRKGVANALSAGAR